MGMLQRSQILPALQSLVGVFLFVELMIGWPLPRGHASALPHHSCRPRTSACDILGEADSITMSEEHNAYVAGSGSELFCPKSDHHQKVTNRKFCTLVPVHEGLFVVSS